MYEQNTLLLLVFDVSRSYERFCNIANLQLGHLPAGQQELQGSQCNKTEHIHVFWRSDTIGILSVTFKM